MNTNENENSFHQIIFFPVFNKGNSSKFKVIAAIVVDRNENTQKQNNSAKIDNANL